MAGAGTVTMGSIKSESLLKMEGDGNMNSPTPSDIYEDEQGDVDFSHYNPDVFLARLPKYLWSSWDSFGDDEEIEIGTLRVEGPKDKPTAMSLRLHSTIPNFKAVPKDFVLQIMNENPPNTYVFTEEDLPGFNSRMKMSGKAGNDANLPMSKAVPMGMRNAKPRPDAGRVDKSKNRNGYFRRAVPKKTALAGRARTELACLPVENEDYRRIMTARLHAERIATQKAPATADGKLAVLLGGGQQNVVAGFTKAPISKAKPQQNKNVRMAQNELLDAIYKYFREYRYWRLKSLVQKLKQPEAWIKQNLIHAGAHLIQSGPKTGTYALNDEQQKLLHLNDGEFTIDDEAPDQPEDDGDGDVKMEM